MFLEEVAGILTPCLSPLWLPPLRRYSSYVVYTHYLRSHFRRPCNVKGFQILLNSAWTLVPFFLSEGFFFFFERAIFQPTMSPVMTLDRWSRREGFSPASQRKLGYFLLANVTGQGGT